MLISPRKFLDQEDVVGEENDAGKLRDGPSENRLSSRSVKSGAIPVVDNENPIARTQPGVRSCGPVAVLLFDCALDCGLDVYKRQGGVPSRNRWANR